MKRNKDYVSSVSLLGAFIMSIIYFITGIGSFGAMFFSAFIFLLILVLYLIEWAVS